jgi:hypothetical protein
MGGTDEEGGGSGGGTEAPPTEEQRRREEEEAEERGRQAQRVPLDQRVQVQATVALTQPDQASQDAEAAATPTMSAPTADANRFTVYVPYDKSTLSIGKANDTWIADDGLTVKTNHHAHIFVVGDGKPTENTLVTIGKPTSAHTITSHSGGLAGAVTGYGMITSGHAWHDAQMQHVVMSRTQSVTVRALAANMAVGLQADEGFVYAFGGKGAVIGSKKGVKIAAQADLTPQDILLESSWTKALGESQGAKATALGTEAIEVIGAAIAACRTDVLAAPLRGKADGTAGKEPMPKGYTVKQAACNALILSSIGRGVAEVANVEPNGSVGITADGAFGAMAGISATMTGTVAASVISAGQAELLGGVSAVVKGLAYAELAAGVNLGVASREVDIEAKQTLDMQSEQHAFLTAEHHLVLTGCQFAQLTSPEGFAAVHGEKGAYLGAGGDHGFGVQIDHEESTMHIGKTTAGKNLQAPAVADDNEIQIKDKLIRCAVADTRLGITPDQVLVTANSIFFNASSISLHITDSGTILIG